MLGRGDYHLVFLKGILSRDASSCQVHGEHNSSGVCMIFRTASR